MDNSNEEKFHKDAKDFMDNVNYDVGFAIVDCDKKHDALIAKLKADGNEIFPTIINAGDECKLYFRKRK